MALQERSGKFTERKEPSRLRNPQAVFSIRGQIEYPNDLHAGNELFCLRYEHSAAVKTDDSAKNIFFKFMEKSA